MDKLGELDAIEFKNDEEFEEMKQLKKEISYLKGESPPEEYENSLNNEDKAVTDKINSINEQNNLSTENKEENQFSKITQNHNTISDEELQNVFDKEHTQKVEARTREAQEANKKEMEAVEKNRDQPKEQASLPLDEVDKKFASMKIKEARLRKLIEMEKTGNNIEALEQKLNSILKEQSYVISKPNSEGIVTIDKEKYTEKLAELNEQLQSETGFFKRLSIRQKINDLKLGKGFAHASNGMVKTTKVLLKIGNGIRSASEHLNKLDFQPAQVNKSNKQNNQKKKNRNQKDEEETKPNDYGFNSNNIFGSNKQDNQKQKKKNRNKEDEEETKSNDYGFSYDNVFSSREHNTDYKM